MEEPKLIIIHETILGSILTDVVTLSTMLGVLWINYTYIGNTIPLQIFITVTLFLFALRIGSPSTTTLRGKKDIIKFLKQYDK